MAEKKRVFVSYSHLDQEWRDTFRKLDIGGLEISYGPDDHTGLDFADLSIIGSDGKFKR